MSKLLLYELSKREPVAELNFEGALNDYGNMIPKILFAEIPVMFHLSCDITLAPMKYADNDTGTNFKSYNKEYLDIISDVISLEEEAVSQ